MDYKELDAIEAQTNSKFWSIFWIGIFFCGIIFVLIMVATETTQKQNKQSAIIECIKTGTEPKVCKEIL